MNIYEEENTEYFNILKQLVSEKNFFKKVKAHYKDVFNWIENRIPNLKNYAFKTKCYWILNGLQDFPECQNCGKPIEKDVVNIKVGYNKYCSAKCMHSDPALKEKRKEIFSKLDWTERNKKSKETCIQKYGVSNPMKVEEIKNKAANSFAEKYSKNSDEYFKLLEKKKQTCLKNFGVEFPSQSKVVKEKIEKTCLERYGAKSSVESFEIQEKIRKTIKEKYNVDNVFQANEIKEKIEKTCLAKYGFANPMKNRNIVEKGIQTMISKYGVANSMHVPEFSRKQKFRYTYNGLNFDSAPELAMYIYLTDKNVEFTYQPEQYFSYEYNGKIHRYYPDFKINEKFYEIKGDHFFDKSGKMINPFDSSQNGLFHAKQQCMLKNQVIILTKKEYQQYIQYIADKYGNLYLTKFKNYA